MCFSKVFLYILAWFTLYVLKLEFIIQRRSFPSVQVDCNLVQENLKGKTLTYLSYFLFSIYWIDEFQPSWC